MCEKWTSFNVQKPPINKLVIIKFNRDYTFEAYRDEDGDIVAIEPFDDSKLSWTIVHCPKFVK
ncbi:MAG: hypothetical protein R6V36_08715 [Psychroflexus sp.]